MVGQNSLANGIEGISAQVASLDTAYTTALELRLEEILQSFVPDFFATLLAKPWWQTLVDVFVGLAAIAALLTAINTARQLGIVRREADRREQKETWPQLMFSFDVKNNPILVNTSKASVSCATVFFAVSGKRLRRPS